MKSLRRLLLVLSLTALMAGSAWATTADLAVEFSGAPNSGTNGVWSMGFEFSTNTPIMVSALGFYDNQMLWNHPVGIYDSNKKLLVSTTVMTTDPLVGSFRFHSIEPLLLPAGETYVIAGVTGFDRYAWNPDGFVTNPSITYIGARFTYSMFLVFPTNVDYITKGGFGPNFQFLTMAPVPGSLILLGTGLLGLLGISRRLS